MKKKKMAVKAKKVVSRTGTQNSAVSTPVLENESPPEPTEIIAVTPVLENESPPEPTEIIAVTPVLENESPPEPTEIIAVTPVLENESPPEPTEIIAVTPVLENESPPEPTEIIAVTPVLENESPPEPTEIIAVTSVSDNESPEPTIVAELTFDDCLKTVFIPTALHAHFECVVGKHVFIDKPWTHVSRQKIIDHLNSEKSNSCFWHVQKELNATKHETILIGYKPLTNTDEEFIICTTDQAKQHTEETEILIERELVQNVDLRIARTPVAWESKNSEREIDVLKPVPTREKITIKWKVPAEKMRTKTKYRNSNLKNVKNEYVKLEPRPKEIFESVVMLTRNSSVQAAGKMVIMESQTIPRIKDHKCLQSVAVEEEVFQLKNLTQPTEALDDFLEKHVPNLVEQLCGNELYDLYRDDYKLLKNDKKTSTKKSNVFEIITSGNTSDLIEGKYVSSQRWHPTIVGVFALSYKSNENLLLKTTENATVKEVTMQSQSRHKNTKYSVSRKQNHCKPQPINHLDAVLDSSDAEKITFLLNKEFVQKMRMIEIAEDEKSNEHNDQDASIELLNTFIYPGALDDEILSEVQTQDEQMSTINDLLDNVIVENDSETQNKESKLVKKNPTKKNPTKKNPTKKIPTKKNPTKKNPTKKKPTPASAIIPYGDNHQLDAYDTDSFYNIWGSDKEWLYGNQMRDTVRNIHRQFNKKYSRSEREKLLFELLMSEAQYTKRITKFEDIIMEKIKLTKTMFQVGDGCHRKLRNIPKIDTKCGSKSAKQKNDKVMTQQEKISTINNKNSSVIIYSADGDEMTPRLILESPEEVCCIEFNPRHGNTIVGGLSNGQICIWDIEEKLEEICAHDINVTEREKTQNQNNWKHLGLLLNVASRIKPTALSNVFQSHESTVTAIQWLNPMTEITPLGQLVTVTEKFSDQFLSSSMDGTIKFWDLQSTPMPNLTDPENSPKTRYERPKKLKKYVSPLSIYNNRLKPTYTIVITDPESRVNCPITALSFEIPCMQYNCMSDPSKIGKQHFEYVPETPTNDPNRILVIGNVLGRIGVVTWNGYDSFVKNQEQEENCTHIWWGQVHDGPINCIKRNYFYPDIHLASSANVVSIWSVKYKGGPIWWKRFDNPIISILWSSIRPAEFRMISSNGQFQCWNLMKYTHQPSDSPELYLQDVEQERGELSATYSSINYGSVEQLKLFKHSTLDYNSKNEFICYLSSTAEICIIAISAPILEQDTIEEVGRMFQKEVDWRKQLDADNENYRKEFGSIGENDIDTSHYRSTIRNALISAQIEYIQPASTSKQIKKQISDETFKWYFKRKGPQTRVKISEMKANFLEREKQHMVETMMKKQNVTEKQLYEYAKNLNRKNNNEKELRKIKFDADESYKKIVNKLSAADKMLEYVFDVESLDISNKEQMKNVFNKIHHRLTIDYSADKESLRDYIKNNPYTADEEYLDQLIKLADKQVRKHGNDPYLLRSPDINMIRQMIKNNKDGKKYGNEEESLRMKMSVEDESYEQLFENYSFEDGEGGEGDRYYRYYYSDLEGNRSWK